MEQILLKNMLFAASFVMYAYGIFSFFTLSPMGKEYYNYRVARKTFGAMMIILASCLLIHWHFDLRQKNPLLASSLCLLYITPGSMLLSVIFSSLIKGEYPFEKRLKEIALCIVCLGSVLAANYIFIPQTAQHITLIVAALFFIVVAIILTVRFYKLYRITVTRADNYYSDNVGKLIQWIPITIFITILFILAIAILSIASHSSFITLYLFLGVSIFTYIFISLQNYMINIAKLKLLLLTDELSQTAIDDFAQKKSGTIEDESRESKAVRMKLDNWIKNKGFTEQALTINDLALKLNTNRTYLSSHIKTESNLSFRSWIATQRIEYSKELLLLSDESSSSTIANAVGYSPNAFIKIFIKAEGMTPMQWRAINKSK
ncbi:MAG: helix-turn-helix domain-containing protein [Rikenellaceae bacterium]